MLTITRLSSSTRPHPLNTVLPPLGNRQCIRDWLNSIAPPANNNSSLFLISLMIICFTTLKSHQHAIHCTRLRLVARCQAIVEVNKLPLIRTTFQHCVGISSRSPSSVKPRTLLQIYRVKAGQVWRSYLFLLFALCTVSVRNYTVWERNEHTYQQCSVCSLLF